MNIRQNYVLLSILVFLNISLLGCVTGGRSGIGPGENAPGFALKSLSGGEVSLEDLKGKLVLVNFWASWCVPCISELPSMERLYQRLKDKGFVIVAIGIDDEELRLREFQQRYNLSFPVLVDPTGRTKKLYGVTGVPESFLIGRDGKLIMVPDFDDNKPTVRIVGPRHWDSPTAEGRIAKILQKER